MDLFSGGGGGCIGLCQWWGLTKVRKLILGVPTAGWWGWGGGVSLLGAPMVMEP